MAEPFLGEIRLFPFNFAPRNWTFCWGQILSIQQNAALFSLIGTTYGGNGTVTFALPDLRGRTLMSAGSSWPIGAIAGTESVTLLNSEMPMHGHGMAAYDRQPDPGTSAAPGPGMSLGRAYAVQPGGGRTAVPHFSSGGGGASSSLPVAGASQPHENRQPYLVMNYCVAMVGIFPSRD
jgi:microcystin-dependent protein